MSSLRGIVRLGLVLAVLVGIRGIAAGGEPASEGDALVARLVHPDRQAAEVLRLFEGARWSDPASALAAWKQEARGVVPLGKPAEALIALFNPEMVAEWRAFDGAEIHLAADPSSGDLGWFAFVPRDDGTVAAGITAMRLTYPDDKPLVVDGRDLPVAQLGRSGVPLACVVGTAVTVASSRDLLLRAVRIVATARETPRDGSDPRASGTFFRLEPGRIPLPGDASLSRRRTIEALRALGCRRVEGTARLKDSLLVLDVSTTLDERRSQERRSPRRAVESGWLEGLPSAGVMAMVSLAIDPASGSWDRALAVADRVERVDPRRAGLAPLRSRINLLAAAAGIKLEADLRPHLRGLSACLFGDPAHPGRVTGALLVLHLDDGEAARRLVADAAPRVRALMRGAAPDRAGVERFADGVGAELGKVDGRPVCVCVRGRAIRIAWGEGGATGPRDGRSDPGTGLARICGGWGAVGREPPDRVGAFWPARLWLPAAMKDLSSASLRVLGEDPPVVWWGWSEPGRAHDLVRWAGLRERAGNFLMTLPPDPGEVRPDP
jgi:hypothetical protein